VKKYSSIIVTGSIAYDVIMDFPGKFVDYFQKDKLHQINVSFVVDRLEKQLGGTAINISYNLSLLSIKKVLILGAVGKDGGELLNFFKANKIGTQGIIRDNRLFSSNGQVMTDFKDNQIWGYYYGAAIRGKRIELKKYADNNSLIVISASHPESFLHFQKEAINSKIDYLYDPGMCLTCIKKDDLWNGTKHSTFLVGNDYEISMISKMLNQSINQLIKHGTKIITTLGEKGVNYQDKNHRYHVSSYKVKKLVDPTGAGDAWRGGFLAGILNGKKIIDSLKLGNVMASFAIEKYGTVNHKPSKQEISKRLISISNY